MYKLLVTVMSRVGERALTTNVIEFGNPNSADIAANAIQNAPTQGRIEIYVTKLY